MAKRENSPQEEPVELVILEDQGAETEFELIDMIEFEGRDYVAMIPYDPDAELDQVIIMEVRDIPGEEETREFLGIEDEILLQRVFREFQRRYESG